MSPRVCLALGALLAAVAVSIGAFGAHWLSSQVPKWYEDPVQQARMLDTWEVGVRYQMYSSLGLITLGLWGSLRKGRPVTLAAALFLAGILIFSALLYLLVLTGQRFLGAIVPIGGLAMIAAWALFAWQAWRDTSEKQ